MAKKNSEKIKLIAVCGLGAVLIFTVVYQLFLSSPPPRPTLQSGRNNPSASAKSGVPIQSPENAESAANRQNVSRRANDAETVRLLLEDQTPINTKWIVPGGKAEVSWRGSIFEYYKEPPPKPEPPPPPPPITLQMVSPTSVTAGTPRQFTLTVVGQNIPPDGSIYINGSPRKTRRVNETTLATDIAPSDYSSQATWTIEVKSPADPAKWYSTNLSFSALPSPEPPFKFIGLLGEQALIEIIGSKEYLRIKAGSTIQGVWRVDAISNQAMNVTQTQFDIKKRVPLQDKPR
jgi:hypothetical protein